MMRNPIPKNDLFITPEDIDHLFKLLRDLGPNGYIGAVFALNYAHMLIENEYCDDPVT